MYSNRGNAIAQYSIIIALVILALIPVFYMFGNTIVEHFSYFNQLLKGSETTISDTSGDSGASSANIIAGSLGGTPGQPVKQCADGKCDIDFGEFILTGIPENYQEYVQSAGTSGGTEMLLSLLEQIADQLEADGDLAGAVELRELANMGHKLASIEHSVEKGAKKCTKASDPQNCFEKYYINSSQGEKSLDDILRNTMPISVSSDNPFSITDGAKFYSQYNDIMSNDKFSESIKGITQGLFSDITRLSYSLRSNANGFTGNLSTDNYIDPLTGREITVQATGSSNISIITNPKTGSRTHLDSFLICQAGWNEDTGSNCY